MSDDLLRRATRALRDTTAAHSEGMEAMLSRIERSRAPRWHGRARRRAFVFAAAASLSVIGAWAGVTGRVPLLSSRAEKAVEPSAPGANKPTSQRPIGPGRAPAPTPSPIPERAPVAAAATAEPPRAARERPVPSSARLPSSARQALARGAAPAASAASATRSASANLDALYRDAHTAHFERRDWAVALAAWDRYLSSAGQRAPMLVEARYNRAIALARLGQQERAIEALSAFANGEYGGYRREEARRVIDVLKSSDR